MRNVCNNIFKNNAKISGVSGQGIEKNIKSVYDEWRAFFFAQNQGTKTILNPKYFSGLCMVIKKECLEKLNGFDEMLTSHAEDVDFAYKCKKHNFLFLYEPDLYVYHYRKDDYNSLCKMIFNHIYWACLVHKKNNEPYFIKYFFASFKVFFINVYKSIKIRKYEFLKINFIHFFIRISAVITASKKN